MIRQSLNGAWEMYKENAPDKKIKATVPGSVYSTLLENKLMANPYYRENEYISTPISEDDYVFTRTFIADEKLLSAGKIILRFYGVDTIALVVVNGRKVGGPDNMHRTFDYVITRLIKEGENTIEVHFTSPIKYITEKNTERELWGLNLVMPGFSYMRKAHYMFGWDWGPKLPDMGIWRDVELLGISWAGAMIDSTYIKQNHSQVDEGIVALTITTDFKHFTRGPKKLVQTITAPNGKKKVFTVEETGCEYFLVDEDFKDFSFTNDVVITDAELWYPRGYGKQPLYELKTELIDINTGEVLDERTESFGLRTVTVSRAKIKEGGEEFAFVVNGIKIFAMGANYIPEDNILSNITAEKTDSLLKQCAKANFNMIRVWGGGFYPADSFYDSCDKLGILVWQDFMFACAAYRLDSKLERSIKAELSDNIKRFRNHPSLAMWCGNNEVESAIDGWGIPNAESYKQDYLKLFEDIIPKTLEELDPQTYYHPSSPSTYGNFKDYSDESRGDSHYWDVWHNLVSFKEYGKHKFRFCSEYGFESLPNIKTIEAFAEECDYNLMGSVMEAHQKCWMGSEKLMFYIAQMVHYPYKFESLIYATQLVQADAIRLNVEAMRRFRGICMGSLYWQVNDSNPVISWSSIDYYHRHKALHYYAKRFYAPIIVSANTDDITAIKLNVSSEKQVEAKAKLVWHLRATDGSIFRSGEKNVVIAPLSSQDVITLTAKETGVDTEETAESRKWRANTYLEYELKSEKGKTISRGTTLFVQPKAFNFKDPKLEVYIKEEGDMFRIDISANAYAKAVYLDLYEGDCLFSDNWFDIHANTFTVYAVNKYKQSVGEFAQNLSVKSYYTAMGLIERGE